MRDPQPAELPAGKVAFLFADLAGSTALLETHPGTVTLMLNYLDRPAGR
jgi:hypothetical protein